MINLTRRIERLEDVTGIHGGRTCIIVVTDYPEEPTAAAVARYRAENSDIPEDANFIVVVTGFSRAPGDPLP